MSGTGEPGKQVDIVYSTEYVTTPVRRQTSGYIFRKRLQLYYRVPPDATAPRLLLISELLCH